jgi:hypothetical protein
MKSTFTFMPLLTLRSYVAQLGTCSRVLVKCAALSVFTLRLTLSHKNGEVRPSHPARWTGIANTSWRRETMYPRLHDTLRLKLIQKRLVAGFPPRRPGFAAGSGQVGFVVNKLAWGRSSPSTSVSPANLHSTKFSIMIITRGRYNRPFSGRRAEWTHLDSTPHYAN